jgi:hypothetical protein
MQTKKLSRVLGIVMAIALIALAPLFFAGCDSTIKQSDATKNAKEAATAYFTAHKDYASFANTTYTSTSTKTELGEYTEEGTTKTQEVITSTKTSTLTLNTTNNVVSGTLTYEATTSTVVKNLTAGTSGNPVVEGYRVVYTFGKMTLQNSPAFVITKQQTPMLGTGQLNTAETVKEFFAFTGDTAAAQYATALGQMLHAMNEIVGGTFETLNAPVLAEIALMMGGQINFTKSGDKTVVALSGNSFSIIGGFVSEQDFDYTTKFNKKELSINGKSSQTTAVGITLDNSTAFSFKEGANEAVPVITGFTEAESLQEIIADITEEKQLPSVEGFAD